MQRRRTSLLRHTIVLAFLLLIAVAASARAQGTGTGTGTGNGGTNNGGGGTNNGGSNNGGTGNAGTGGNANGNQGGNAQQGSSSSAAPTTSSIPDSAPLGGLTVTQPAETAQASYYKIAPGALITFGWNFTDVLATPTSLAIEAVCTKNGNTYELAPTGIPGTATNFTWDPYSYYQNAAASTLPALIQATYRLVIRDPQVTVLGPGLLAPNTRVQFALYIPQAYTPLASGWFCADCSSALSLKAANPIVLALIATFAVMLAGGSNILARAR